MSILGKLSKLIFGASVNHADQSPMHSVPHPDQTQSSDAGDNKAKYSESYVLAAQQRAETVLRAFNESLNIAKKSKNRGEREYRIKIAHEWLIELKKLTIKFPFLSLQNLQAVEADIVAVEAETRSLPYGEVVDTRIKVDSDKAQPKPLLLPEDDVVNPGRSGQDRQHYSARDEQAILMCIQSCFRVVNESIDIARKSKNIETKISRLGVARDRLKMAREQAGQFSLDVKGFDEAKAEINRIDEAIKAGTPTEIAGMPHIETNDPFASPARDLLKEATALKKEKKYIEACDKLREAYLAEGSENLMIEDRLRLPMYLQLAGKNDDGWDELNRLYARYTDQFSQPRIEHQMKIFLRKEKNETASNPVRVILRDDNKPMKETSASNGKTINEMHNAPLPAGKTVGELQSESLPTWGNDDIITGLRFSATLQLRTPLRVLLRHGEIHTDRTKPPPRIALEMWEGTWLPVTKHFVEIAPPDSTLKDIEFFRRLDAGLNKPYTIASDVGTILADDYLPFLIAVRRIIEAHNPIEQRIEKLREIPIAADWQVFVSKHGGIDGIIERFFPKFMNLAHSLDTPNRIAAASDESLLAIKGIGAVKLKAIRERCACVTENRGADRVENVIR